MLSIDVPNQQVGTAYGGLGGAMAPPYALSHGSSPRKKFS